MKKKNEKLEPKTSAERQAAWMKRVKEGKSGIATATEDPKQGAKNINIFLPTSVAHGLIRISTHKGETKSETVTRLIIKEEDSIVKKMSEKETIAYYAVCRKKPGPQAK